MPRCKIFAFVVCLFLTCKTSINAHVNLHANVYTLRVYTLSNATIALNNLTRLKRKFARFDPLYLISINDHLYKGPAVK